MLVSGDNESGNLSQVQNGAENRTKPYGDGEPVSDADGLGNAPNLADNPGGNLETVASSEPEKKPGKSRTIKRHGVYGRYLPEECVQGWRDYQLGSPDRGTNLTVLGSAVPLSALMLRAPKAKRINVKLLMYWHIELFLLGRRDLRAKMLAGDDLETCAAFSEWWRENPFQIWREEPEAPSARLWRENDPDDELTPLSLSEACEKRGIKLKTALEAIARDRLTAWRPDGKRWTTTLMEIDRWKHSDQRKAS